MAAKPKWFGKFDKLARQITAVPKAQVDAKIAADRKARRKNRKKKQLPDFSRNAAGGVNPVGRLLETSPGPTL